MCNQPSVTLLLRTTLLTFTLLGLVACGGGGGSKKGTPASTVGSSLTNTSLSNNSVGNNSVGNNSVGNNSAGNSSANNGSVRNSSAGNNSASKTSATGSSLAATFLMGGALQGNPLNLTAEVSTLAGALNGTDGVGLLARFDFPKGIADDGTHLYVADGNDTIRKVVIATGEVTTFAGIKNSPGDADGTGTTAQFKGAEALVANGAFLYVADSDNHAIRKIEKATGLVTTFAGKKGLRGSADLTGVAAQFNNPQGICATALALFVADTANHTIRRVLLRNGQVTTVAGLAGSKGSDDGTGAAARFNNPVGITTDGTNLFVLDVSNNTLRKIVISTGEVTTLAGTAGVKGSSDGKGSAAQFDAPRGIATDGTNLFVADTFNKTLRKIVINTGDVTTLVGSAGKSGDADGAGNAARFHFPQGVTVVGSELYVADQLNNSIRKVALTTAEVSTFAGVGFSIDGTGAAAQFQFASGMTTDGTNLYLADTGSNSLRKIAIDTGEVTTLAGAAREPAGSADGKGSEARFNEPIGITTNGTSLYVTDSFNHTVRELVLATGEVTTLAGTVDISGADDSTGLAATFNEPNGITTDGPNLYVADTLNHSIRKIVIATKKVTTLAGTPGVRGSDDLPVPGPGLAATFNEPAGITTDGTHLYVADAENHTIRKIVISTGAVSTLAGTAGDDSYKDGIGAEARFVAPKGITTDGTHLYVSDTHHIRKIEIATGLVTTLAGNAVGSNDGIGTAASFARPNGITSDGIHLYVVDSDNNTIRKLR
jgi:hypothetical protein